MPFVPKQAEGGCRHSAKDDDCDGDSAEICYYELKEFHY